MEENVNATLNMFSLSYELYLLDADETTVQLLGTLVYHVVLFVDMY